MTPDEATDLAARILAAITESSGGVYAGIDRERVASDLAGLRAVWDRGECDCGCASLNANAIRYAANLRRTAALYGVTA